MTNSELGTSKSASDEIFANVEKSLDVGSTRDLWWSVRSELADNGPGAVRTYLQSEHQRRRAIVEELIQEISDQVQGIS